MFCSDVTAWSWKSLRGKNQHIIWAHHLSSLQNPNCTPELIYMVTTIMIKYTIYHYTNYPPTGLNAAAPLAITPKNSLVPVPAAKTQLVQVKFHRGSPRKYAACWSNLGAVEPCWTLEPSLKNLDKTNKTWTNVHVESYVFGRINHVIKINST